MRMAANKFLKGYEKYVSKRKPATEICMLLEEDDEYPLFFQEAEKNIKRHISEVNPTGNINFNEMDKWAQENFKNNNFHCNSAHFYGDKLEGVSVWKFKTGESCMLNIHGLSFSIFIKDEKIYRLRGCTDHLFFGTCNWRDYSVQASTVKGIISDSLDYARRVKEEECDSYKKELLALNDNHKERMNNLNKILRIRKMDLDLHK